MDTDLTHILSRHPAPLRRLTTAEFYRMAETGILGPEDRVELIEGQLIAMSAIGVRHANAVDSLTEQLVMACSGKARVRVQNPISLADGTEPQPDFVVARIAGPGRPLRHPIPEDIFLVVEVSDASLAFDSRAKRELYARSAIPEYWIVDLTRNAVRVHRKPTPTGYASETTLDATATLDVEALPGVTIAASPLFA